MAKKKINARMNEWIIMNILMVYSVQFVLNITFPIYSMPPWMSHTTSTVHQVYKLLLLWLLFFFPSGFTRRMCGESIWFHLELQWPENHYQVINQPQFVGGLIEFHHFLQSERFWRSISLLFVQVLAKWVVQEWYKRGGLTQILYFLHSLFTIVSGYKLYEPM